MITQEEGSAESFFRKTGKRIDDLLKDVQDSEFVKKIDLESRLNELKKDKDRLKNQFQDFSKENEQSFEDVKNSMNESIEEIKNLFKKAKTK